MRNPLFLTLLFGLIFQPFNACLSQESDSTQTLESVTVRAFEQGRNTFSSTANVKLILNNNAETNNNTSLVQGFNTIAGVRMEERSPGSYRINIRGSSLRSPFGVRNVKVYWNEIPVTDPGGNTYFNQLALNNFHHVEIFKGPAGSLYGAGTGGLALMHTTESSRKGIAVEYITGSFGLHNILASGSFGRKDQMNHVSYAHTRSDGYRRQSGMRRDNFSWTSKYKTSEKNQLIASLLFSDMDYETPGALTIAEYNNDPKASRPAAGIFPSAEGIDAAIYQKNLLAGFANHYQVSSSLKNISTLYGAFAQIKNSAIRNYERRNEPHFGGRTSFIYSTSINQTKIQGIGGAEFQQAYFNTQVADNRNGLPDSIQTNDDVSWKALTIFLQGDVNFDDKWIVTAGASLNNNKVNFRRLSEYPVLDQDRTYRNEIAPRISLLKKFGTNYALVGTYSKGFSPPTVGELLPSTGIISTFLEAEKANNYEASFRANFPRLRLNFEITAFYMRLKDALVQRRDLSGADYFENAGSINQKGIETHVSYLKLFNALSVLDYFTLRADHTFNHFKYDEFVKGSDDFSGNVVPSVPSNTLAVLGEVVMKKGIFLLVSYYNASKIYLNDANTASAEPYHILGGRLGFRKNIKQHTLNLFLGIDNGLNEKYSLGNDINAAANRFYNAAPARNYYMGIGYRFYK